MIFRDTSVSQRRCRFNSESNLIHYPHTYTRGLCLQECRLELVYQYCRCIPHFYPNRITRPKRVCSYRVLKECVGPKKSLFLELRTKTNKSIECGCLQNCVDSDVFISGMRTMVDSNQLLGTKGGTATISNYPVLRLKRKILFSLTDLYGELFPL